MFKWNATKNTVIPAETLNVTWQNVGCSQWNGDCYRFYWNVLLATWKHVDIPNGTVSVTK